MSAWTSIGQPAPYPCGCAYCGSFAAVDVFCPHYPDGGATSPRMTYICPYCHRPSLFGGCGDQAYDGDSSRDIKELAAKIENDSRQYIYSFFVSKTFSIAYRFCRKFMVCISVSYLATSNEFPAEVPSDIFAENDNLLDADH